MKKAYRVMFPEKLRVVLDTYEFDDSPPGESELVIETLYSGVSSGTELARLTNNQDIGHWKGEPYPAGSGYAAVGKIVAAGDEVTGFRVGDVVFSPVGHASHHRVDSKRALLVKVPDSVLPEDAVYVRFCSVSMTTLRTTTARPGDGVAVLADTSKKLDTHTGILLNRNPLFPARQSLAASQLCSPIRSFFLLWCRHEDILAYHRRPVTPELRRIRSRVQVG